jgi:hypothetical protein
VTTQDVATRRCEIAVAGAATNADPMVCRTEAGVTHCEAPLNHYRVTGTRKGNRTYFEDKGPPLDDDRGGLADHRHAALTRGDIGGPKRMKTGRCVRCPRANGAPLLGSRLMGKDSGGQWRLRTAKPPCRRRSRPECTIGPDPRQFASSRAAIEEPHMAGASELVTARRLLCPHRPTFRERTRTRSRICGWTPFRVIPAEGREGILRSTESMGRSACRAKPHVSP